jgi:hypothetical protein
MTDRTQVGVGIVYEYLIGKISAPDMVKELRANGFDVVTCNTGRQILRDTLYGGMFDAGL